MTEGVSEARFFSLLEDRKGNLWFGTIGSGVYLCDGTSLHTGQAGFQNFTIKDGLINNEVTAIYEDKAGNIWFGASGGASRYDGRSFRNYTLDKEGMNEDRTGKTFSERQPYEVNSIIEDKAGRVWFATRGNTFIYNGKTFTPFAREGKTFRNVRTIIEDRRGKIWLSGNDGLWRYDGSTFTNIRYDFVGYVYEGKQGNILTSSGNTTGDWALCRYDEKALSSKYVAVPEVIKSKEGMIFGILEASDGSIWFGTLNGVNRFDGVIVNDFKFKQVKK
jgi:ligand-binding sensor domain-containing protein